MSRKKELNPDLAKALACAGKVLVVHRPFIELTGSVNAAMMLSQCLYWSQFTDDPEGWIYKTREDWTAELGLSRREQEYARRALVSLGILVEAKAGNPCRLHYRVDLEKLVPMLESMVQNSPTSWYKTAQPVGTKRTFQFVQNVPTNYYKKNTTLEVRARDVESSAHLTVVSGGPASSVETSLPQEENPVANVDEKQATKSAKSPRTKPTPKSPLPAAPVPDALLAIAGFAEEWESFKAYRVGSRHKAMSEEAQRRQLLAALDAHRMGWDLLKLIDQAVSSGYAVFCYPEHRENPPRRVRVSGGEVTDTPRLKPGLN